AALVLHERTELVVPALRHDLGVNVVTLGHPSPEIGRPASAGGHPDGAVERHPRHELAVHELPAAAACLPDALVRIVPVFAEPVHDADDGVPSVAGDTPLPDRSGVERMDGVHRLAVDVELQLAGRAV